MNIPLSKTNKSALEVAKIIATLSGDIILKKFNTELDISFKGRTDVVTDADRESEESAIQCIQSEYPDHNILSEESFSIPIYAISYKESSGVLRDWLAWVQDISKNNLPEGFRPIP